MRLMHSGHVEADRLAAAVAEGALLVRPDLCPGQCRRAAGHLADHAAPRRQHLHSHIRMVQHRAGILHQEQHPEDSSRRECHRTVMVHLAAHASRTVNSTRRATVCQGRRKRAR